MMSENEIQVHDLEVLEQILSLEFVPSEANESPEGVPSGFAVVSPSGFAVVSPSGFAAISASGFAGI